MKSTQNIVVDPPTSDARRERIEQRVMERLVIQPAAPLPEGRGRAVAWWVGGGALAAAAGVALWLASIPAPRALGLAGEIATADGVVVELGEARLAFGAASRARVERSAEGGWNVILARGSVTSEVAPRQGGPPYRVSAGDVVVQVVGTKFTVERGEAVAVGVEHGRVQVTRGGESVTLEAGQRWPEAPAPVPEVDEEPRPALEEKPDAKALYERADDLQKSRAEAAARLYRQAADRTGFYAAAALFALVQLELDRKRPAAALRAAEEYLRRFPRAVNADETRWLRIEALLGTGREAEARAAAQKYLTKYPKGTYAESARAIVDTP